MPVADTGSGLVKQGGELLWLEMAVFGLELQAVERHEKAFDLSNLVAQAGALVRIHDTGLGFNDDGQPILGPRAIGIKEDSVRRHGEVDVVDVCGRAGAARAGPPNGLALELQRPAPT